MQTAARATSNASTGKSPMAERRRRPELLPHWPTIAKVAQHLRRSPPWPTPERLARLQETEFPIVDPSLERIDREAIDDWSDRRSGGEGASAAPEDLAPTMSGGAPSTDAAQDPGGVDLGQTATQDPGGVDLGQQRQKRELLGHRRRIDRDQFSTIESSIGDRDRKFRVQRKNEVAA